MARDRVALQKNYISCYISPGKNGGHLVDAYANKLGALKVGYNMFNFERVKYLDAKTLAAERKQQRAKASL